jgi:hypothetical protein
MHEVSTSVVPNCREKREQDLPLILLCKNILLGLPFLAISVTDKEGIKMLPTWDKYKR